MDSRKDLEALCEIIQEQIADVTRKIRNNGMSSGDLETVDKLTHTLKSIKGTMAMMEGDGYANRGSYARHRDSLGRYSGERGYSRNALADRMRELMHDAPDDRTRQEMQRMIDKLDV